MVIFTKMKMKHNHFLKNRGCLLITFSLLSNYCAGITVPENEIKKNAVDDLIKRLIGEEKSSLFSITVNKYNEDSRDEVSLNTHGEKIHISATSGVAAAYGFHYYLKNYCKAHVSWDSDQLKIPTPLPHVQESIKSMDKFRYYQNVVTYSYSYVWWTWTRWEREIDWMALNGINLALAFTGQEAIWLQVYKQMNMTFNEIGEHFSGPSFLAWNRMGNLRRWGEPLTDQWQENSINLQHKILSRMKALGIIPILPAFCGHVPRAFGRLFPNVTMMKMPAWAKFEDEFCCPYLLDPEEKLFQEVGEKFMYELKRQFGLTHYYNCDTFNEMVNPFEDVKSLAKFSSTVFNAMIKADANATWILQGWLFLDNETYWTKQRVKNYLSGVPNERMIILDLQSETAPQYLRLNSYFGKPFIWCMLHNFGGNLGMHGSFDIINERVIEARNMVNSTMIGTGLAPEGINQNYVVYDFMTESSWRNAPIDTNVWIENYSERRYGTDNNELKIAWKLLKNSVYNYKLPIRLHGSKYVLCRRPSLKIKPLVWYNISDVLEAWDLFINASEAVDNENIGDNYYHDLVDVTRQALQLLFDQTYKTLLSNYLKQDLACLEKTSSVLLQILMDLEAVLSTNTHFMLGVWLNSSKSSANSYLKETSSDFFVKNQITLWGPKGEILDYATKQWSGMVIDYYYPRWKLFCDYLSFALKIGDKFDQNKFNDLVFETVEDPFCRIEKNYPFHPTSDTVTVAQKIHKRWREEFFLTN